MILPVLGLLAGVAVGMLSPITVPLAYAKLSSVAPVSYTHLTLPTKLEV